MTISQVSYKQAAQVAGAAIAVALLPPVGALATIGCVGLALIGYVGVEFADQIKEGYINARHKRLHCVVPLPNFSPAGHEDSVEKAVTRFRNEKSYEWLTVKHPSLEVECAASLKYFGEGCCHGAVSTLFFGVIQRGLSLEESARVLHPEEVFFRQLVQRLGISIKLNKKEIHGKIQIIEDVRNRRRSQNLIAFLSGCLDGSTEGMKKVLKEFEEYESNLTALKEEKKKLNQEKMHLKEKDPLLLPVFKSQKFSPKLSYHFYQRILEETINSSPMTSAAMGAIRITKHVMGFQYGSNNYYIFDTFSEATGGLLKYSDKKVFFKKMRTLVLQVIPDVKKKTQKKINVSFHLLVLPTIRWLPDQFYQLPLEEEQNLEPIAEDS